MRCLFFFCLLFCCLILIPTSALAQQDPTLGPGQFPQFRNLSALAGSGYGLDAQGYPSLSGPTAFSTPVAHTMGHGHLRLEIGDTSFHFLPTVSLFDSGHTNGTAFATLGVTVGPFNIAGSYMLKSFHGDQSYNAQIEWIPPRRSHLAASFGVQDIEGRGGAAGQDIPGDNASSRSIFGVLTYRVDTARSPVYVSLGIGRHRFRSLFGSASYQVTRPLRLWIEHDGFGINEGVLLAWRTGQSRRSAEWSTLVGLQRGRYFTIATGFGF